MRGGGFEALVGEEGECLSSKLQSLQLQAYSGPVDLLGLVHAHPWKGSHTVARMLVILPPNAAASLLLLLLSCHHLLLLLQCQA
jgi:hypothetical protein